MSLASLLESCFAGRDAVLQGRQQGAAWESWLAPISEQHPAGKDPAYTDDFQRMREEVDKLSGGNAEHVVHLAQMLFKETCKDLRVVTYYIWARLHKDGEAGLADGLSLLAALLHRYPNQVLPMRNNSRKMALEWMASSKVLDSLSCYPEVVRAEAERTVAALAWLEEGLQNWPEDQRPELGALYSALAARLSRSGGIDAVVPQHSGERSEDTAATPRPGAPLKSGRDLLDCGRSLAAYLRDQPQGWLAAHRLMKSLRWDTVHQTPPQDGNGLTRLLAPRGEYRAQLKRLYLQQDWEALLALIERIYAEGVNHFWLDLQWYLCQVLERQSTPQAGWAAIVQRDLGMFLERLPGLETLCWSDGSALADQCTRDWIAQHVSGNHPQQWQVSTPVAVSTGCTDVLSLESEALAQADGQGVEHALAWLSNRPDLSTGRERWLLRLLMARVAEQYGKNDLAVHLLTELDAVAQTQALTHWEPELAFEVKARLLKLLRGRALRNDVDRPALNTRMDGLLCALVTLDPVRAAVLCG